MQRKLKIMFFFIASVLVVQTAYASSVTITNLGTLPGGSSSSAYGINDNGQIVGCSSNASGNLHAVLWENGAITDLGTLPGGSSSSANGINNNGQIVGYSSNASGNSHAVLWENGVITDLGTLPGGSSSSAYGINDNGQIVGSNDSHACYWQNGVITDLGNFYDYTHASGINDNGQIVGYTSAAGGPKSALLWQNGAITYLGTGGYFNYANGINNNGQIVGSSDSRAFLWQKGAITYLGTPEKEFTEAYGINNNGQIVGSNDSHAVLWENGAITDLGTTLSDRTYAKGINDNGQIVGYGQNAAHNFYAILWTVTSAPVSPIADFTINVTQGYVPLAVQFTDLSINSTSRNWDFENNGNIDSTEETPVHVYINPGTYTVNLTAINENGADSKTATINVLPAPLKTPTITWNNPADIIAGTALGPEQLNAIATDPNTGNSVTGTFTYNPQEDTVLEVGTHTLHADFTPSDSATYNNVSADVQINVLPAPLKTPTIVWNHPPDITVGTALSGTQLNAAATDPVSGATVDGTFTYNPAAGIVLSAGMGQMLHVDFVPTDTTKYNAASKDVTINVLVTAPTINSIVVPLDPVPVSTPITTSADVTYLGNLDTLIAEWNWGDGSTSKSQGLSNFETSHVYNSVGIYTIKLTVTDAEGRSETKEAPNYVVIYDPQGGFVTGGGWINSPAGAYVPDKTLSGKATFGFVSKYEKGATVPTGKTEFQFNVADLNFHSESYDWLVVAESKAKYKGTGTINGEGNYGFMLSAVDGAVDKFRIKIWEKESGNTIYDNEMGAGEDSEPSTAISGGSIIVHKKK